MNYKKLPTTIVTYHDEDIYEYKTIFNKGRCYACALFINDVFDVFTIFEAEVFYEEHVLPEEVIVAHTFESAATEFNELTYLHYTNN